LGIKRLLVYSDSAVVINQVNKSWDRNKENMDAYCLEVRKLENKFYGLKFHHIVLLRGCVLGARQLWGYSTSAHHLGGSAALPSCSGADPPTPTAARVDPWPPLAMREMCTSGGPPPQISND
jgi:hypothetical protein